MTDRAGDDLEIRRKRLRFRSWHRGTREMDMMLGAFADRALESLTPQQLDRYEALLSASDPDIYDWITGREPAPEGCEDLVKLLRNFRINQEPH
jgi:antitoxin CptB